MAALLFSSDATAQNGRYSRCGPRDLILAALLDRYGEAPVMWWITAGGAVLELLGDVDGTTWSMLKTWPDRMVEGRMVPGRSCVMEHGFGRGEVALAHSGDI